ncbi:annexin B9 [Caerostris extrusa]|uniref:Annexin B9 n=1 Tax=Caerostris extrusa TaxID=172846 RepID=A0AAV4SBH5_CAEEX|nr:annexin B9 [Caerostris extrusa]
MVDSKSRGIISPATDFNVEHVISRLRKAMRGIGTDEKLLLIFLLAIVILKGRLSRRNIKTVYGKVLKEDIKAELGGHFEDICLALLTPLAEYIVDCFYFAIKGFRTDENCIIELLVSLESMDLRYVKTVFLEKYNQDLADFLTNGLNGDVKKLVSMLVTKEREFYAEADDQLAQTDAQRMLKDGLYKSWKNEDFLPLVLTTRSKLQLQVTITAYEKIAGHSFNEAVKAEFEGV